MISSALLCCFIIGSIYGVAGSIWAPSSHSWYQGCYSNTQLAGANQSELITSLLNLTHCSIACSALRYPLFGVSSNKTCSCLSAVPVELSPPVDEVCFDRCAGVPCQLNGTHTSVFLTKFPSYSAQFVTNPPLITEFPESISLLAEAPNQTEDGNSFLPLGFEALIIGQCTIGGSQTFTKYVPCSNSASSISCQFSHAFSEVGHHDITCALTYPGGSTSTSTSLETFLPRPNGLTVALNSQPHSLPACVHHGDGNPAANVGQDGETASPGSVLVFVDEPFEFVASLHYGVNSSFLWDFGDGSDIGIALQPPCGAQKLCMEVFANHTYAVAGDYILRVDAYNHLGTTITTIIVRAVDKTIDSVSVRFSVPAILTGSSTSVYIDLLTADLYGTLLGVSYGDGANITHDLINANASDRYAAVEAGSVLTRGSYGTGCLFQLALTHTYERPGSYIVTVRAYNGHSDLSATTLSPLEVVNPIVSAVLKIRFSRVFAVGEVANFSVAGCPSSPYTRVQWTLVSLSDDEIVRELNTTRDNSTLLHAFTAAGSYMIQADVTNAVAHKLLSEEVIVQAPVTGLGLVYQSSEIVSTESTVSLRARVTQGTDVSFRWQAYRSTADGVELGGGWQSSAAIGDQSDEGEMSNFTLYGHAPGLYFINVFAENLVSEMSLAHSVPTPADSLPLVHVQEDVGLLAAKAQRTEVLVDETVSVTAVTLRGSDLLYTITFGDHLSYAEAPTILPTATGEIIPAPTAISQPPSQSEDHPNNTQQFWRSYSNGFRAPRSGHESAAVTAMYSYRSPGLYIVRVRSENDQSVEDVSVPVRVESSLDGLQLSVYGSVRPNGTVIVVVADSQGGLLSHGDTIYEWSGQAYPSALPLLSVSLGSQGTTVNVTVRNQVTEKSLSRRIALGSSPDSWRPVLSHASVIEAGTNVSFTLQGFSSELSTAAIQSEGLSRPGTVVLSNGEGLYSGRFENTGLFRVIVIYGRSRLESVIAVVDNPGVSEIIGPSTVSLHRLSVLDEWEATPDCFGCVFTWNFGSGSSHVLPYSKVFYEYSGLTPGVYPVIVSARGAIGSWPVSVQTSSVRVTQPLVNILPFSEPVHLGSPSELVIQLLEESQSLNVTVTLGDGSQRFVESANFICEGCSDQRACSVGLHHLCVTHYYTDAGNYHVTVSATNGETTLVRHITSQVDIGLSDTLAITSSYNRPIPVHSALTYSLDVGSATHVNIRWQCVNVVGRHLGVQQVGVHRHGSVSRARFKFSESGVYNVSAEVNQTTGLPRVVYASGDPVTVAVPLTSVSFFETANLSAYSPGNSVSFKVVIAPSGRRRHMMMLVDFGDDSESVLVHADCSSLSNICEGSLRHTYDEVGEYTPVVTVLGELGNHTEELTVQPLYIQQPIMGLSVVESCENIDGKLLTYPVRYIDAAEPGSWVTHSTQFTAETSGGSGVQYEWTFGDGTGESGQQVTHQYLSSPPAQTGYFLLTLKATNKLGRSQFAYVRVYIRTELERIEILFNGRSVDPNTPVYVSYAEVDSYTVGYSIFPPGAAITRCRWTPYDSKTNVVLETPATRSILGETIVKLRTTNQYNHILQLQCDNGLPDKMDVVDRSQCFGARNMVSGAFSPAYSVNIEFPVDTPGLYQIVTDMPRVRGESIEHTLYTFSRPMYAVCNWAVNDTASAEVTVVQDMLPGQYRVNVRYSRSTVYAVSVRCRNNVSDSTITELVEVLDKRCKFDTSSNSHIVFPPADPMAVFLRDEPITLECLVPIDCDLTQQLIYSWVVTLNGTTTVKANSTNQNFYRPAFTLLPGVYNATCVASVDQTVLLKMTGDTVFRVESIPLVASIRGGLSRSLPLGKSMTLSASHSYEPECQEKCANRLRFIWSCEIYGSSPPLSCFNDTDYTLPYTSHITILSSDFRLIDENNSKYNVFSVNVTDSVTNSTSISNPQYIYIVPANRHYFDLECPQCEVTRNYLSQSQAYRFRSTCSGVECAGAGSAYWIWKLYYVELVQLLDYDKYRGSCLTEAGTFEVHELRADINYQRKFENMTAITVTTVPGSDLRSTLSVLEASTQSAPTHVEGNLGGSDHDGNNIPLRERIPVDRPTDNGEGENDVDLVKVDPGREKTNKIFPTDLFFINKYIEQTLAGSSDHFRIEPGQMAQSATYIVVGESTGGGAGEAATVSWPVKAHLSPLAGTCRVQIRNPRPERLVEFQFDLSAFCRSWRLDSLHDITISDLNLVIVRAQTRPHGPWHLQIAALAETRARYFTLSAGIPEDGHEVRVSSSVRARSGEETRVCVTTKTVLRVDHPNTTYTQALYNEWKAPQGRFASVEGAQDVRGLMALIRNQAEAFNIPAEEGTETKADKSLRREVFVYFLKYLQHRPLNTQDDAELATGALYEILRMFDWVLEEDDLLSYADVLTRASSIIELTSVSLSVSSELYEAGVKAACHLLRIGRITVAAQSTYNGTKIGSFSSDMYSIVHRLLGSQLRYKFPLEPAIDYVLASHRVVARRWKDSDLVTFAFPDSLARVSLPAHVLSLNKHPAASESCYATCAIYSMSPVNYNSSNRQAAGGGLDKLFGPSGYDDRDILTAEVEPTSLLTASMEQMLTLTMWDCDDGYGPQSARRIKAKKPVTVDLNEKLIDISVPVPMKERAQEFWLNRTDANFHIFSLSPMNGSGKALLIELLFDVADVYDYPVEVSLKFKESMPLNDPSLLKDLTRKHTNSHEESTARFYLSADEMENRGNQYLTVGVVDSGHSRERIEVWTPRPYTLSIWQAECESTNLSPPNEATRWSKRKCVVSESSTSGVTVCSCSHLSTFRAVVAPVRVGGEEEMGGMSSGVMPVGSVRRIPLVEITEMRASKCWVVFALIYVLYALVFIVCWMSDAKHPVQEMIIPVIDNNAGDQQKYVVTLETGSARGAGTTAKVSIVLHGEEGMSETRELVCSKTGSGGKGCERSQLVFQRNSRDTFLLTLPVSIGKIWKIQLWHNNAGHSPGWFVKHVTVKDWVTGETYYFLCNKWLAVEEEDGKVDREFMFSDVSRSGLACIFRAKAPQYLADYHLWASLWSKPTYSHFSRTERLTCLLTVICLYCLFSAAFLHDLIELTSGPLTITNSNYHQADSKFFVSWQNVVLGLVASLVVYPIFVGVSLFFRRSHVYRSRRRRIRKAKLSDGEKGVVDAGTRPHLNLADDAQTLTWQMVVEKHIISTADTMVAPEEMMAMADLTSYLNPPALKSLASAEDVLPPRIEVNFSSSQSDGSSGRFPTQMRCYMPYSCRAIGWILCILASVSATVFTILLTLRFDCEFVWHWVKIAFFAMLFDAFVTQPGFILLKALSTAIVNRHSFAIMQHYTDRYEDDVVAPPTFQPPRYAANAKSDLARGIAARQRSRDLRFARPPQEKQLIAARKRTMKEKKFWCLLMDIAKLLVVVTALLLVAFSHDARTLYDQNSSIKRVLLANTTEEMPNGSEPQKNRSGLQDARVGLLSVKDVDSFWQWALSDLTSFLYGSKRENLGSSIIVHNMSQIRQLRVHPTSWTNDINTHSSWYTDLTSALSRVSAREECLQQTVSGSELRSRCYNKTWATQHYGALADVSFRSYDAGEESDVAFDGFSHHDSYASIPPIKLGKLATYGNTGFNRTWIGKVSGEQLQRDLRELRAEHWINAQTRAVFFETTIYNGATKLFSSVVILFEIGPSGLWLSEVSVSSVQINKYRHLECGWVSPSDMASLLSELVFVIVILWRVKDCISGLVHHGPAFLLKAWHTAEVVFLLLALTYVVCFVYRFEIVDQVYPSLIATHPHDPNYRFVSVAFLALWEDVLKALIGSMLFIALCSSLRLLRYVRLFAKFGNVLKRAGEDLRMFGLVFGVIVAMFTCFGKALFSSVYHDFSDGWLSLTAVTSYLTGRFPYRELEEWDRAGAGLYMVLITVCGTSLLYCLIVSLLVYHYRGYYQDKIFAMSVPEAWHFIKGYFAQEPLKEEPKEPRTLRPEFALAEMEYQVEEVLYKINCLTGHHNLVPVSLPPMVCNTDSDLTDLDTSDGGDPFEPGSPLTAIRHASPLHYRGKHGKYRRNHLEHYDPAASVSSSIIGSSSGDNSNPSSPSCRHRRALQMAVANIVTDISSRRPNEIPYHGPDELDYHDLDDISWHGPDEIPYHGPDEIPYHGPDEIPYHGPNEIPYHGYDDSEGEEETTIMVPDEISYHPAIVGADMGASGGTCGEHSVGGMELLCNDEVTIEIPMEGHVVEVEIPIHRWSGDGDFAAEEEVAVLDVPDETGPRYNYSLGSHGESGGSSSHHHRRSGRHHHKNGKPGGAGAAAKRGKKVKKGSKAATGTECGVELAGDSHEMKPIRSKGARDGAAVSNAGSSSESVFHNQAFVRTEAELHASPELGERVAETSLQSGVDNLQGGVDNRAYAKDEL